MLSFLFGFQVQTCQPAQVLFAHRLVHSGSSANSLTVVVSRVGPPVSFGLYVPENHILDGRRKTGHLAFSWGGKKK